MSIDPEETTAERNARLFKDVDVALFTVALAFVVLIAWLCVRTVLSGTASPEEKK